MNDPPPSRSLRLLVAGLLLLLLWGYGSTIAAETRSDFPTSHSVVRANGSRPAAGRVSVDAPEFNALGALFLATEELGSCRRAFDPLEARVSVRGRPVVREALPRAPPRSLPL